MGPDDRIIIIFTDGRYICGTIRSCNETKLVVSIFAQDNWLIYVGDRVIDKKEDSWFIRSHPEHPVLIQVVEKSRIYN